MEKDTSAWPASGFQEEAVQAARNQFAGFSAILTTKFKDPLVALDVYGEGCRGKVLDDLKNELDLKRHRG